MRLGAPEAFAASNQVAVSWPESTLLEDLLAALEHAGVGRVVVGKVEWLLDVLALCILPPAVAHLHFGLCGPSHVRELWHTPCQESVICLFLVAWSIVEHEESCAAATGLAFQDVNGMVNLLKDVLRSKVAIAVLAGFPKPPSLSAIGQICLKADVQSHTCCHH